MNEAFKDAVRWLAPICERLVSNGQIKLPSVSLLLPLSIEHATRRAIPSNQHSRPVSPLNCREPTIARTNVS